MSAVPHRGFGTGMVFTVLTFRQAFAGSAFLGMAGIVLAVTVRTVASVAAHIPLMDIPHLCKMGDYFFPELVAHPGKVNAHITAVSAFGVVRSLSGKRLPVRLLLYQNKLLDLFKLFGSGNVNKHPFAVVICTGTVVIVTYVFGIAVCVRFKDLPLLFAENDQEGISVLFGVNGEDSFLSLLEFKLVLAVSDLVKTVFASHKFHSLIADFFKIVHISSSFEICDYINYISIDDVCQYLLMIYINFSIVYTIAKEVILWTFRI